jgi:hypothetical protein
VESAFTSDITKPQGEMRLIVRLARPQIGSARNANATRIGDWETPYRSQAARLRCRVCSPNRPGLGTWPKPQPSPRPPKSGRTGGFSEAPNQADPGCPAATRSSHPPAAREIESAAKAARVSPERLRRFAKSQGAITKKGRRWIVNPKLPRRMLIYSRRRAVPVILGDQASATIAGRYMSAVGEFLSYQDISLLQPFAGQSVTDVRRKKHPFETDPNWLYRLASSGESFEAVYRIIV